MKLAHTDFDDVVAAMQSPVQEPSIANNNRGAGAAGAGPDAERRNAVRMTVASNVQAWIVEHGKLGQAFTAFAQNVSLVGLELIPSISIAPGQEMIVALPRLGTSPLLVSAITARCSTGAQGRMRCGLEFSGVAPESVSRAIFARGRSNSPAACYVG
jgi:hypothetical protein